MPSHPIGPKRYRIAELADGQLLALDTRASHAYLLTPKPANGSYRLSRSGSVSVRTGKIASVQQPASCSGYRVEPLAFGQIRVTRPTEPAWQLTVGSRQSGSQTSAHQRFAVLDLQGGGLLLVTAEGVSELRVAPAPDGIYRQPGGRAITVRGGASADSGGGPIYHYADDFAP